MLKFSIFSFPNILRYLNMTEIYPFKHVSLKIKMHQLHPSHNSWNLDRIESMARVVFDNTSGVASYGGAVVKYTDFAGSGIVHCCGGISALLGAILIGPRIGKFSVWSLIWYKLYLLINLNINLALLSAAVYQRKYFYIAKIVHYEQRAHSGQLVTI